MVPFEFIVFSILSISIGVYFVYFLICLSYVKFSKSVFKDNHPMAYDTSELPSVSFIIPVYNEKTMMDSKINNLNQIDYPSNKLEVVIVDGGSKDGTLEVLECIQGKANFSLQTIKQGSRRGFNSAVVDGFNHSTGEIIFITGAETQYASDAVKLIVRHFTDPAVGTVNGTVRLSNLKDGVSPKIEAAYRSFYDFLRTAESKIDTPFDIKGEIAATRRNICSKLVNRQEMLSKGCIDACFAFQAKKDGFKTIYEPLAVYSEPAPRSLNESFKQQIRRAATLIQNLFLFKELMFKSRYGLFGSLIMPVHLMMLTILPYFFLFSFIGLLVILFFNPVNYVALVLILICLLSPIFSQGVRAFYKVQIALILATFKMVTGVETQKFERLLSAR